MSKPDLTTAWIAANNRLTDATTAYIKAKAEFDAAVKERNRLEQAEYDRIAGIGNDFNWHAANAAAKIDDRNQT